LKAIGSPREENYIPVILSPQKTEFDNLNGVSATASSGFINEYHGRAA